MKQSLQNIQPGEWHSSDEQLLNSDISLSESDIINKENVHEMVKDVDGVKGSDRERLDKIYGYLEMDREEDERIIRFLREFEDRIDRYMG